MRKISAIMLGVSMLSGCSWFYTPPTRVDNPIVQGVNYVGVTVSDLDKTEQLYSSATAIEVVDTDELHNHPVINQLAGRENTKASTRLMSSVNSQLLFMEFENPSEAAKNAHYVDANGPGLAHVCFQVIDTTETYQKFLAGGAKTIGDPAMQLNPKTHVSYAYARDIDDIMVEIEHVDIVPMNLPKPPKNDRRLRHISLATLDMERAVDFYKILLETENPRRSGNYFHTSNEGLDKISGFKDAEIEMSWFQVRNLELEIIQYYSPAPVALDKPRPIDATGYNMIMFDVTDLKLAKEKLLKAGGTVISESESLHGSEVLLGRDPDGNVLGFQVLSSDSPYSAKKFRNNGIE